VRFLLLAALTTLVACSTTELPAPQDLASACQTFYEAHAAYDARCDGFPPAPSDPQDFIGSCLGIASAPGVMLTGTDIAACAAELDASPCRGLLYSTCTGPDSNLLYPNHDKKGTLPPGMPCFSHVQCDSGYCSAFPQLCGICQRLVPLGGACAGEIDRCADGECTEGTCQLVGWRQGESCATYSTDFCQKTCFCKPLGPEDVDGTCTPRSAPGAACSDDQPCVEGAACKAGVCVLLLPDGAPCANHAACQSNACSAGTCSALGLGVGAPCAGGTCTPLLTCSGGDPPVCEGTQFHPDGAACSPSLGPCGPGLYCDQGACNLAPCPTPGTCKPLPGPGEPCGHELDCAAGTACQPSEAFPHTGICTPVGVAGEPCPCGRFLQCVNGTCLAFGVGMCP
jgi:hypothetical protein